MGSGNFRGFGLIVYAVPNVRYTNVSPTEYTMTRVRPDNALRKDVDVARLGLDTTE